MSPEFLFRIEREPAGRSRPVRDLSHQRSRARLAAVVLPVEQHSGRRAARCRRRRASCSNPAVLEQQVRRMLADPRAEALVSNFAGSGCSCGTCRRCCPIRERDPGLRRRPAPGLPARDRAVRRQHPARRPQRARAADGRLHVRERAAREALRHPERPRQRISGASTLTDDRRRGLLGQGSVLVGDVVSRTGRRRSCAASGFSRICSARRRRRRRRMCRRSRRSRSPAEDELSRCASGWRSIAPTRSARAATSMMDPLGFALENFDIGRAVARRRRGARRRSMRRARCPTARSSTVRPGCGTCCRAIPTGSCRTLTEKLLTYALGRGLEHYDMPAVRTDRARRGASTNYRVSSLVLGVVNSRPFQMRRRQS